MQRSKNNNQGPSDRDIGRLHIFTIFSTQIYTEDARMRQHAGGRASPRTAPFRKSFFGKQLDHKRITAVEFVALNSKVRVLPSCTTAQSLSSGETFAGHGWLELWSRNTAVGSNGGTRTQRALTGNGWGGWRSREHVGRNTAARTRSASLIVAATGWKLRGSGQQQRTTRGKEEDG